jgi:hypothetical protein
MVASGQVRVANACSGNHLRTAYWDGVGSLEAAGIYDCVKDFSALVMNVKVARMSIWDE